MLKRKRGHGNIPSFLHSFFPEKLLVCFIDGFEDSLCYESNLTALATAPVGMHYKHGLPVLKLHLQS